MTSKNQNRIRKKSNKKSPNRTKTKKPRESKFDFRRFSIIMMAVQVILFIFILSSNTGLMGDVLSDFFAKIFGKFALVFPVLVFISFLSELRGRFRENLSKFLLLYTIYLLTLAIFSRDFIRNELAWSVQYAVSQKSDGGGALGGAISFFLVNLIGNLGLYILYGLSIFSLLIDISPLTYGEFFRKVKENFIKLGQNIKDLSQRTKRSIDERKQRQKEEKIEIAREDDLEERQSLPNESPINVKEKEIVKEEEVKRKPVKNFDLDSLGDAKVNNYKSRQVEMSDFNESFRREFGDYTYPSIDLLEDRNEDGGVDDREIRARAVAIEETLDSFGIDGKVVQIDVGPTVTCYELKPQRGVKVSKIVNLSDDLALALATSGIRILAPIPGKSHVGIEVPNDKKEVVGLKEILSSENFVKSKYTIPFAMGKSISGDVEVSAIEKMPHLLVSGATGSGKSVCINTIIMSILYKHSPNDVKLLLVDPKVVELSIYNGIPHLIMPVITDPKKASSSLFWAISEMEKRYKLFEKNHVRDIVGYKKAQESDDSMENLPYIVIIIDELADLMMTVGAEVEDYITRLAQKSRACGIHLIIATQRPTVDVITGTIKANIPSRISFAVTSQIDSRTILDAQGAEKLLGKGDMLYASSDSMRPTRIQGAFVSDDEVISVVREIKEGNETNYDEEAIEKVEENVESPTEGSDDEDELIDEAIKVIINENTASVSMLQRKLKIGYARAGRIIDQLEQRGVVGGYEGSKPRKVLVDRSYLEGEENEFS
ncbi:MAG: DNA translocase FtsK 4TM domain-containing protein [Anaerococcus sp.]|uniref:DNA translocase FtsK 4TM domain-containing protein n=1 Tax=Anaerococcus sp. TaxID=1872515 RepID=UPI002632F880|nr:DNA translocase FtsK 4TM domain-containing protein [Anaerococcus sp.]MCI5972441.1 DNA translocase FtsK 4TM domain-containing protein [Anaerococcus sp.]MDD6918628.1 DNA translocase FtsK 4TM domain-containing protein [Peptoniphilaceae bacterium]MDY2928024.1 DNA translocase FtsK 4TM domain-containing protein [Anaerococcus sp.]